MFQCQLFIEGMFSLAGSEHSSTVFILPSLGEAGSAEMGKTLLVFRLNFPVLSFITFIHSSTAFGPFWTIFLPFQCLHPSDIPRQPLYSLLVFSGPGYISLF